MRVVDTNVLIYTTDPQGAHHAAASKWLADSMQLPGGVGFAWSSLIGFIRITTRAGILRRPLQIAEALAVVEDWIAHPGARVVSPGPQHAAVLGRLLLTCGTAGNLTNDAHLAALAIEHGAELGTFDRDFKRFDGLAYRVISDKTKPISKKQP